MKTLTLTTPLTQNKDVLVVQKLLKRRGWLQGPEDSIYGPATARSVQHAKYMLGYPKPDQTAGDAFVGYLSGKKKPTPLMIALALKRKRQQPVKPLRLKMLDEALKHVGVKEYPPGSNHVVFSDWYGITGPWCAMFVTYCGFIAESKAFVKGMRWAYVPYMVNDAKAGRNGLMQVFQPQQGDLVAYDWNKDGVADHIGLFYGWEKSSNTFRAIEGNTAIGNDSNGGEVMVRNGRSTSDVQCWIRVVK